MMFFVTLIVSCGLMSLATLGYGMLVRSRCSGACLQVGLGVVFGTGAMVTMLDPYVLAPGVIMDGRSLFIGLAAGFLGPLGALGALAIGVVTRVMIGGDGMVIGVVGLCLVTALGMLWKLLVPKVAVSRTAQLLGLGALLSLSLGLFALLPASARDGSFYTVFYLAIYLCAGAMVFGALLDREDRSIRRVINLVEEVARDPLTGLLNRRRMAPEFDKAVVTAKGGDMALVVIDVDHFKSVNDTHGHKAGDRALVEVAQVLVDNLRTGDALFRIGGEEFMLLLPATRPQGIARLASRLVHVLRLQVTLPDGTVIALTSSVGAAHFTAGTLPLEGAMAAADAALYEAKNTGRNRSVVHQAGASRHAIAAE